MPPANIVLLNKNAANATENDLLMIELGLVQTFEFRRIIEKSTLWYTHKKKGDVSIYRESLIW